MKLKPLNDWAVIIPSEAEVRTAGGLYIPDAAKEKPAEGVVEAIGPGALEEEGYGKKKKEKKDRKFIPTTVKPGDRVLYEKFAGQKITVGGQERVLVREQSILGVFSGTSSSGGSRPLQLPAKTTTSGDTSLAALAMTAITAKKNMGQGAGVKGQGKAKKQTAKKAAKKGQVASSKGQGKAKKNTAKKAAAKPKKVVKKAAKKGKKK